MKILYTGAITYNTPQPIPSLSIGGFVSSSQIYNAEKNNLFSNVSELTKQNLTRQSILIALKNDDNDIAYGIRLIFNADFTNLLCDYEIAFIGAKKDSCDNYYFEKLNDYTQKPFLTFSQLSTSNYIFDLPDMQPNRIIGIWLIRKINSSKTITKSCDALIANYIANTPEPNDESFSLDLTWNDDDSNSDSASAS